MAAFNPNAFGFAPPSAAPATAAHASDQNIW